MPSSKLISCAQLNESVCFPFYYKVFEMVEVVEKEEKSGGCKKESYLWTIKLKNRVINSESSYKRH